MRVNVIGKDGKKDLTSHLFNGIIRQIINRSGVTVTQLTVNQEIVGSSPTFGA